MTHPEFYPLENGLRYVPPTSGSAYWQPDLGREDVALHAADAAQKYFEANPTAESFSLGINDGLLFGESPETIATLQRDPSDKGAEGAIQTTEDRQQRTDGGPESGIGRPSSVVTGQSPAARPASSWFRNRPDYSPLVFTFMNRAAAELEKTHPDKYLGALAYYWAENAPGFPVHRQVIPFLTADRSQGYDPDFWKEEMDLQERWAGAMGITPRGDLQTGLATKTQSSQRADGLGFGIQNQRGSGSVNSVPLWQKAGSSVNPELKTQNPEPKGRATPRLGLYDYLEGAGFLIPRIHTRLIAENLRHAWEVGFTDYYGEGEPNWGIDGPMHWLVAQLTQDPTQSPDRLLEEYYRRMYGPAAEPMRTFFERCEELWMGQPRPAYWIKYYFNEDQAGLFPAAARSALRSLLDQAAVAAGSEVGLPRRGDRDPESGQSSGGLTESALPSNPNRGRLVEPALPRVHSTNSYAKRVALASDAFGVTERFAEFQEARDALSRRVLASGDGRSEMGDRNVVRQAAAGEQSTDLGNAQRSTLNAERSSEGGGETQNPEPKTQNPSEAILRDLEAYLKAKALFLSTVTRVWQEEPLAMARITLRKFMENDPTVAALLAIRRIEGERPMTPNGGPIQASVLGPLSSRLSLPNGWQNLFGQYLETRVRIDLNGDLAGPPQPAKIVAGLIRRFPVPVPWVAPTEPAQQFASSFIPASEARKLPVLRISGAKGAGVWERIPLQGTSFVLGAVQIRGRVSPGNIAFLVLGWENDQLQSLGQTTFRLPPGGWPSWVSLEQGGQPPVGTRWVTLGIRVEHQVGDDWIEVRDFQLSR